MGQAIDRHLLALKLQAIEEGLSVPRIFMDTAYGLATHWKLRTGQVTPSPDEHFFIFSDQSHCPEHEPPDSSAYNLQGSDMM